jgi:hypothetical protein
MWTKFEFSKLSKKDLSDVSEYVVEINRLTVELNRLTRTSQPQWSDVDAVVTNLRSQCTMIQRLIDQAYES